MAPFYSFTDMLKRVIKERNPKHILEWGPGVSTSVMLSAGSGEIDSVEHDLGWYDRAVDQYKDEPRVHLHYCPDLEQYPKLPATLNKCYGLVFVDGLCDLRVACLHEAVHLLEDGGYVVLHDSEREKYNPGRAHYHTVIEYEGTALMVLRDGEG